MTSLSILSFSKTQASHSSSRSNSCSPVSCYRSGCSSPIPSSHKGHASRQSSANQGACALPQGHWFEFYFTIPTPDGDHVFYPYHPLSRPQAIANGWNWRDVLNATSQIQSKYREACNFHTEKAGLGGKGVNKITIIYWMATHF